MAETLHEILLTPGKRPEVLADCKQLLDEEVSSKSGASGLAVKSAYTMVKAVKPGIINESIDKLLDDFIGRLQPFYADYRASGAGQPLDSYLAGRGEEVSDALLGVTDDRAANTSRATIKKAYEKIRPQGKKNVELALPRLGKLIEKHVAA
ncbi:DUF6918 family protein [Fodinicola feengrottensis]|uniref:Uncharacterized protein n=1 Tax=Fodinicola feengrottensis TaxID=435914 RepID=A0ABP4VEE3_9ACTN|nr:hypothetical protein [Fodinicola feengrottensis]